MILELKMDEHLGFRFYMNESGKTGVFYTVGGWAYHLRRTPEHQLPLPHHMQLSWPTSLFKQPQPSSPLHNNSLKFPLLLLANFQALLISKSEEELIGNIHTILSNHKLTIHSKQTPTSVRRWPE